MHLLLGIHQTLMWNRVLQHIRGWLLQILLRCLLRGRWCWGTWPIHKIFHPFEVNNLGAMVSIVAMLTAKSTREVHPKVFVVVLALAFFFISPLGVLVPLVLVDPTSWFC
jgi:hypothetical protein